MDSARAQKLFPRIISAAAIAIAEAAIASPQEIVVPGPGSMPYGSHAESSISNQVEVDTYTFAGLAGDHARVVLSGKNGSFNPHIVLRTPDSAVLKEISCDGGAFPCSTLIDQILPTTGVYTLNISDAGLNNTGSYSLHLDRHPPTTNLSIIEFNSATPGTLDHLSDSDYFGFHAAAGKVVEVTFAGLQGSFTPNLEIWGPGDNSITNQHCDGGAFPCVTTKDFVTPAAGLYKIGLTDFGFDSTGDYTLGLSCLSAGGCVPEPSTYALMFAGLALTGFLVRTRKT